MRGWTPETEAGPFCLSKRIGVRKGRAPTEIGNRPFLVWQGHKKQRSLAMRRGMMAAVAVAMVLCAATPTTAAVTVVCNGTACGGDGGEGLLV